MRESEKMSYTNFEYRKLILKKYASNNPRISDHEGSVPNFFLQNVNFFQIGLDPLFDFFLFFFFVDSQKIDLIECKLWGRPPSLLEKVYILNFFWTLT